MSTSEAESGAHSQPAIHFQHALCHFQTFLQREIEKEGIFVQTQMNQFSSLVVYRRSTFMERTEPPC